jgi:L-iditol 2-dehydrogenase
MPITCVLKTVLLDEDSKVCYRETSTPKLQKGDILVEMKVCGLCGSDIEKLHGRYKGVPPIIGHEASGIVAKANGVKGIEEGDRIFPHHHVPCYRCYYCKHGSPTMCPDYRRVHYDPGGFAEYFRFPKWNIEHGGLLKLPKGMSFEEASFIEPTACCIRALSRYGVKRNDVVIVIGAGPIGLTFVQLLRNAEAEAYASDLSKVRLKAAKQLGAIQAFNPLEADISKQLKELTEGRGADIAIVASSSPKAIIQGFDCVRRGGTVGLFGVPAKGSILEYDFSDLFNTEKSIISSNATTEKETRIALNYIHKKKIDVNSLITHKFKLKEFDKAVQVAAKAEAIKVLITS